MRQKLSLVLLLIAVVVSAQNIAYVNRDSILLAVPKYAENLKSFSDKKDEYTQEITNEREVLNTKLNELVKPYNRTANEDLVSLKKRMNAQDTIKLGIIEDSSKSLIKKEQSYNNLLSSSYKETIVPILVKVDNVISEFSKSRKIDAIYDITQIAPALVYMNKSKNITKDLVKEIQLKIKK